VLTQLSTPHPRQLKTLHRLQDRVSGCSTAARWSCGLSAKSYSGITSALQEVERIDEYDFPDQELLSDVFLGRWVALPYGYNALKTPRIEGVHDAIWRDDEVRAVHYNFATKPWHETKKAGETDGLDETGVWWWRANWARMAAEREAGVEDQFSQL
jgi:hypothetical protein